MPKYLGRDISQEALDLHDTADRLNFRASQMTYPVNGPDPMFGGCPVKLSAEEEEAKATLLQRARLNRSRAFAVEGVRNA
jgi:hypothetical protein